MDADTDVLRDIRTAYHALAAASALLGPHAATVGDGLGAVLALAGAVQGHRRPALTLTASSCVSWLASNLIHGSPL